MLPAFYVSSRLKLLILLYSVIYCSHAKKRSRIIQLKATNDRKEIILTRYYTTSYYLKVFVILSPYIYPCPPPEKMLSATANPKNQQLDKQNQSIQQPNTVPQQSVSPTAQTVSCPNFDEQLDLSLLGAEMDIDLKTSKSLSGKQYILAIPITQFFRNVRNMYALVNILNGQSIISLRLIEYFVVNYVLENNTFFDINRYNRCPEFLIRNLREKVYAIPEQLNSGHLEQQPQQVIEKHSAVGATGSNMSVNIEAQKLAYRKARDEIIADIQAKKAATTGGGSTTGLNGRSRTTTAKPAKKQPITLETFFSQRAITDFAAQQKQQQPSANSPVSAQQPKNFDNYIIVHDNYKCQLKEYNKKNFDPFCRWNRIRMYYDKNKFFYTTIAQLNFFKWAIEKHILDYVIENLETIEKSMNEYEKSVKAEKQLRKARQLLEKAGASSESTGQSNAEVSNNSQPGQEQELARGKYNSDEPDTETEPQQTTTGTNELLPISLLSTTRKTVKKNIILGNTENKSKTTERFRKKKDFTKTNRSILLFNAFKIVSFD